MGEVGLVVGHVGINERQPAVGGECGVAAAARESGGYAHEDVAADREGLMRIVISSRRQTMRQ